MFVRSGGLYAVRFDPGKLEAIGQPLLVLDDLAGVETIGVGRFSFSARADTLVYMAGQALGLSDPLVWLEAAGTTSPALPPNARYSMPAISPDGTMLAFSDNSQETKSADGKAGHDSLVYVMPISAGTAKRCCVCRMGWQFCRTYATVPSGWITGSWF